MPPGKSFYTRTANLPDSRGRCADISMNALALVDVRLFEAGLDAFPVLSVQDECALNFRTDHAEAAAVILHDGWSRHSAMPVPEFRCGNVSTSTSPPVGDQTK